jgi:hypothetical protein
VGHVCDGLRGRRREQDAPPRLPADESECVQLMHTWPRLDHGNAGQELGWQPRPIHDSIRRAAQFYRENRWGGKRQVVDYACIPKTPDSRSTYVGRVHAEPARSIRRSPR